MTDEEPITAVAPESPFSAPEPPADELDDAAAAAAEYFGPDPDPEPELEPEQFVGLDPRGAGRDLALALRGVEEIDARLAIVQTQMNLVGVAVLVLTVALLAATIGPER